MLPIHQPISRRIIAGILLLNHTLMSCYGNPNPTIEPSKETTKVPVLTIHPELRLEDSEVQELPIVPYVETMVQGNFEEKPIQTIQSRPIQTDSERNQLTVPLASKENTPTPVQPTADNRQVVKQTHQPIVKLPSRTQLPPMIIYPNSQSTEQVHKKEKQQHMQQLELVQSLTDQEQQELHASIVQTLQNPIWKRYVLNKEINTTHLLPDTQLQLSPMRREYQLARVQGRLQPLVPMLSLQTREKHHIILVQDMGYWWGIIQDKRPGLSRNVAFPVLYPNHADVEELSPHTVEALMQMPVAVQEQLVHIFSRDRSLKNGFVYTGEEMGLDGGFLWFAALVVVGAMALSAYGNAREAAWQMNARKAERAAILTKLKNLRSATTSLAKEAKGAVADSIKNIKENSLAGYQGLSDCLPTIDDYISDLNEDIKKIKGFRNNDCLLPGDKDQIDKDIAAIQKAVRDIEEQRKELIKIAEEQAEAAFQENKTEWDQKAQNEITKVEEMLESAWAPRLPDDPESAIQQIQDNISACKEFKEHVKFLPNVLSKVKTQIQVEKRRLADITPKVEMMKKKPQEPEQLPKKNERDLEIQRLKDATDPVEIEDIAKEAFENGDCELLELAIKDKRFSVQTTDLAGNTLLHLAVKNNQLDVAKLLLECGAKKDAVNEIAMRRRKEKITPETLAAGNKEMEDLLKNWK